MKKNRIIIILLLTVSTLQLSAVSVDLIKVAKTVANGNASPKCIALSYSNNNAINNLRILGLISDRVYQENQRIFQNINDRIIEKSIEKPNISFSKQKKIKTVETFKPGTDTDIILTSQKQPVTLTDVKLIRKRYNRNVQQFLSQFNLYQDKNIDWSAKNETDFLVSPESTSQFESISRWINKNGGTAYCSAASAIVEEKIRNNVANIQLDEAITYNNEMTGQILTKLHESQQNDKRLKKITLKKNAEQKLQNCQANKIKFCAQVAKYLMRKYTVSQMVYAKSSCDFKNYNNNFNFIKKATDRNPEISIDRFKVIDNISYYLLESEYYFYKSVCRNCFDKSIYIYFQFGLEMLHSILKCNLKKFDN